MQNLDSASLEEQIKRYSQQLLVAASRSTGGAATVTPPPAPPLPQPTEEPTPMPREEAPAFFAAPPEAAIPAPSTLPERPEDDPPPAGGLTPEQEFRAYSALNPQQGIVRVQTLTARGTYPVQSAQVVISKLFTTGEYIIATENTDEAGLTRGVSLPAPNRELSELPGSATPPYSEYRVTVSHPNFSTIIFSQLPVFSGITAMQTVNMIPLAASPHGNSPIEYATREPNL